MSPSNKDFNLFKKKKVKKAEQLVNVEAMKIAGFMTSAILTANKAIKDRASRQNFLVKKKEQAAEAAKVKMVIGFISGALMGAIGALLLTPESGDSLRNKISHYFDDTTNKDNLKKMAKSAKKKASSAETKVNGSV